MERKFGCKKSNRRYQEILLEISTALIYWIHKFTQRLQKNYLMTCLMTNSRKILREFYLKIETFKTWVFFISPQNSISNNDI